MTSNNFVTESLPKIDTFLIIFFIEGSAIMSAITLLYSLSLFAESLIESISSNLFSQFCVFDFKRKISYLVNLVSKSKRFTRIFTSELVSFTLISENFKESIQKYQRAKAVNPIIQDLRTQR